MDHIINQLIKEHNLNEYEALVITGMLGILTVESFSMTELLDKYENKLKPILQEILTR